MGKTLLYAEVRPDGLFVTDNTKKRDFTYVPLVDISATVEECPSDPNRHKAMNPKWLSWSQHQQTTGQNFRVLLNGKLKEQDTQLVNFYFFFIINFFLLGFVL